MTHANTIRRLARIAVAATAAVLAACGTQVPLPTDDANAASFQRAEKAHKVDYVDREALAAFERGAIEPLYRVGEGDKLTVSVWGRPEVSGKHTVGPDGRVAIPLAGTVKVALETRDEAAGAIRKALLPYYQSPSVTVSVDEYTSNRVILLGRVENPGIVRFDAPPTLFEALARGGALPVLDKKATLTRCAIFRGREQVIWVDLRQLLNNTDSAYNIRLKSNDLIYIPDSDDTLVYVMGDVHKPGSYRLTPGMSVTDALAQAGGPNENAAPQEIAIYRPSKKAILKAPLASLMTADRQVNVFLEEGDIVFVPRSGMADIGYVLRQIAPGLSVFTLASLFKGL
jgi:polysaccharide export outer membrane protein